MSDNLEQILMLLLLFGAPLLGVALRMTLRLIYGARGPAQGDDLHSALSILSWVLIVIGAVVLSLLSLIFGVLLLAIFCGALLEYVLARRRLQRETSWAIVTQAVRRSHNIAKLVSLQKERFSGVVRNDLEGFAWQMANGESLPTSIAIWGRAFPREAQGYAAIGKNEGTIALEPNSASQRAPEVVPGGVDLLSYLAWVLVVGVFVVTGMMVWIVPAFRQIFADFEIEMPPVTQSYLDLAAALTDSMLVYFLTATAPIVLLLAIAVVLFYLADLPVLQGLADRLQFGRHRAQVLRLLAAAAQRGLPFQTALQNLSLGHPRFPVNCAARPLSRALRSSASGMDWKDALARAGLLKPHELPLLAASEKAQNLPWALRALAERLIARSHFRWEAIRGVAAVACTITVGLLVMWFCVAMFAPLVTLISSMS